jgi:hypothetical protein
MRRILLTLSAPLLLVAGLAAGADRGGYGPLEGVEAAYLDWLDARSAVAAIEEGAFDRYGGLDLSEWRREEGARRADLSAGLRRLAGSRLGDPDAAALAAMRRSVESTEPAPPAAEARPPYRCRDGTRPDLDYAALRQALEACFGEIGGAMRFEDEIIDRGTTLQRLHLVAEPERRRALFDAFGPLWTALNGGDEPDSPYRRLIGLAAQVGAGGRTEVDAAAHALGIGTKEVERWLVRVLEAWRDATGPEMVEPWDYRYVHGEANRRLDASIPADALLPTSVRFYADLGADPRALGVVYDLAPREGKSPYAYADFLRRGRERDGRWERPVALVVATYPEGGLFALNELVHELGHAVHVSAIHSRPAYMDWPDTLFTEAFADVTSWSVYEPAWQRRYLDTAIPQSVSMRALYSSVMLDVAWGLFELRMLGEPGADPNTVWTDITSRYLHIRPHPEVPWWAMRVQLASDPGYMVYYALGAILTAEMRQQAVASIGTFDAGRRGWYDWASERLLRYGAELDTRTLLERLLGRPVAPDALVTQLRRVGAAANVGR